MIKRIDFKKWRALRRPRIMSGRDGSAAVEFALTAPLIIAIAAGLVDFGSYALNTAALQGATRVGAEYALGAQNCVNGIQSSACATGIENAMSAATGATLSFSPAPTVSCDCGPGVPATCGASCATGFPRTFITLSATQSFSSLFPWPGISPSFPGITPTPTSISAALQVRVK